MKPMITAEKAQVVEFVVLVHLVAYKGSYMHFALLSETTLSTCLIAVVVNMMILSIPVEAVLVLVLVYVVALVNLVAMLFLPVLFLLIYLRTHHIHLHIRVSLHLRDILGCSLRQLRPCWSIVNVKSLEPDAFAPANYAETRRGCRLMLLWS